MNILNFFLLISSVSLAAQVGINTNSPVGTLHIDGAKDNPTTGTMTTVQALNDFVVTSGGLVGIRNTSPQKSLDVEANNDAIRLRNLSNQNDWNSDVTQILVRNPTNGDVNGISYVNKVSVTLAPNATQTLTIPAGFGNSIVMLSSMNGCGRTMVSSFNTNDRAINFMGGIARDVIAVRQLTPIPPSGSGSATWTITFPNVTICDGDGIGNQFDYRISKPSGTQVEITNLGTVSRTYSFVFKRY